MIACVELLTLAVVVAVVCMMARPVMMMVIGFSAVFIPPYKPTRVPSQSVVVELMHLKSDE